MSIETITATDAGKGALGQRYLATGQQLALRMWHETPAGEAGPLHRRDYETVGYVIAGRVELELDGDTVTLGPGDSWCVPKGAERRYRIVETLTAVEATAPPAREADDSPVD